MVKSRVSELRRHLEDHFGVNFTGLKATRKNPKGGSLESTHMEVTLGGPEKHVQSALKKLALNEELKKIKDFKLMGKSIGTQTHGYSRNNTSILPYGNKLLITIPFKSALAIKIGAPKRRTNDKPK
ncbi:hypothetical protein HUU53_00015 [Candidatus Micrarchaeota archaeon]|nr:hypothetical protein [Candidatus Micrarchaeota archaeon]